MSTNSPSHREIRQEIFDLIHRDLVGPAGGEEEEVYDPEDRVLTVRERYLSGMLAPQKKGINPEEMDSLAEGAIDTEDGDAEAPVPPTGCYVPSSFGLTFSVEKDTKEIEVSASWGSYTRKDSKTARNKDGEFMKVWGRTPRGGTTTIKIKAGKIQQWEPDPDQSDVYVQGKIRKKGNLWFVTLFLINGQVEKKKTKDSAWIFQAQLSVQAVDGSSPFCSRIYSHNKEVYEALDYQEERTMDMVYRDHVQFASGHGVSVESEVDSKNPQRAKRISTRAIPFYEVPQTTAPTPNDNPDLEKITLDMKELSELNQKDLGKSLKALPELYRKWIEEQEKKIPNPKSGLGEYKDEATEALKKCKDACERIQKGLDLLVKDDQAHQAFQFMNQSMWLQRTHSIYSQRIKQEEKLEFKDVDLPQNRRWYPFQLAFILMNLASMVNLHHPDRLEGVDATADLLWFPTGGGKTEAYLGMAAYTLAIRRLQGVVEGRRGDSGVAVLMRYTLRVLTLQQFQRATTLICACESIRREALGKGQDTWGTEPFRIGLWVGGKVTPNYTDNSDEWVKRKRAGDESKESSPHQLTSCPWCGSEIKPGQHIQVETYANGHCRTLIYCGDSRGRCLFSQRQAPGEGLPIVVVDEEIYRRLPSLLISTVDKFAQMPWNGKTQMLFGQVEGYCEHHGFRSPEVEDAGSHPAKKRFKLEEARTIETAFLRPPDLIIQDELHLISGPLGTLVGLYETAVDAMCSWEVKGKTVYPKIIASTATIKRASDQIKALFVKKSRIFPPSGVDIQDNFFALQRDPSSEFPGRLYMGVCAPGRRLKVALIRTYSALLSTAQAMFEKYGKEADHWMTLVGYFNSIRELGGMLRIVTDTVTTRLKKMDRLGLVPRTLYPQETVQELTSRLSSTDIPEVLDRLEQPFIPLSKEPKKKAKEGTVKKKPLKKPLDVLLATNMISVGVDVKRLGVMVVAGQPKTTAEYIQATSRVGRSYPGLVCTVYTWSRPRDISHYENFEHYHKTFYKYVEALSVTPFAPRALDRGLSAVLISLLRLQGFDLNPNKSASGLDRTNVKIDEVVAKIVKRAGQVTGKQPDQDEVEKMLRHRLDQWYAEIKKKQGNLGYQTERDGKTLGLLERPSLNPWGVFTCPNSLRNVEPLVSLVLNDEGMDTGEKDN